jgi:hypothetical protein
MSKPNKANKNNYSQAGRLTADDMARELKKMSEMRGEKVRGSAGARMRAPAGPKVPGSAGTRVRTVEGAKERGSAGLSAEALPGGDAKSETSSGRGEPVPTQARSEPEE